MPSLKVLGLMLMAMSLYSMASKYPAMPWMVALSVDLNDMNV